MTAGSFAVDLGSLAEFANELATQLDGLAQPLGELESMAGRELRLGAFGEAMSLAQHHGMAVADLHVLVSRARDAVDFAEQITKLVAAAYQQFDGEAAGSLAAVTGPAGA